MNNQDEKLVKAWINKVIRDRMRVFALGLFCGWASMLAVILIAIVF